MVGLLLEQSFDLFDIIGLATVEPWASSPAPSRVLPASVNADSARRRKRCRRGPCLILSAIGFSSAASFIKAAAWAR
jgi:hypothetical protein